MTGDVVSSGQIERDFGVCGDTLPAKRNRTLSSGQRFHPPTLESATFVWVDLSSVTIRMDRKRTWRTRECRRLGTWGTVMGDSSEETVHDWGTVAKRQSTT